MTLKQIRMEFFLFLIAVQPVNFVRAGIAKVAGNDTLNAGTGSSLSDSAFQNQPDSFGGAFVKTILALLVILAVVYILAVFLKRFVNKNQSSGSIPVNVVGSKLFSPKKAIYIVDVQDKRLVIGVTDSAITKLAELNIDEEKDVLNENREIEDARSFKLLFSNMLKRRKL